MKSEPLPTKTVDLVFEFLTAFKESLEDLRDEIRNVHNGGIVNGQETICFELRGEKYTLPKVGRNRDLCLGFGEVYDKSIALRCLLDAGPLA